MENFQLPKAPEIKFFQSAEYNRRIQKAKNRLRAKPFIERFKTMNTIAIIGTFFFPTISVITSIAFIHFHINGTITQPFISMSIAMLLLTMIELTKNHLLNNGLNTFFSNSGKSTLTFLFALLFSVGSFFMSYQGAELLVKNLDKSTSEISDSTSFKLATIEKKYNNLIQAEQAKIEDLNKKAKRQWKGLNTPAQNQLLLQYESNLKTFRDLAEKERKEILSNKKQQLIRAESSVLYNAYIFKIFAAINEFLTILSIVFTAFYAFKTVREDLDLNDFRNQPEKYTSTNEGFPSPIELKPISKEQSLNDTHQRNVVSGFLKPSNHKARSPLNDESRKKRSCKYCGKEFTYKHWNKQFCTDACRIASWERKTGKKLNFKPS